MLQIHGQRAPDNLKPLQGMLESTFDTMRTEVQERSGHQVSSLGRLAAISLVIKKKSV